MSELSKNMNCYILAGGKSSRMGTDKGLILFKSKPIIAHVIDVLKPVFKEVIIVSNNNDYSKFNLTIIPDLILNSGPAGGIYSALCHSTTSNNFIVSCDMPFISTEAVENLISESKHHQITVPVKNQKFEPLFAVYSSSCAPLWKQEIDKGILKLQHIMAKFDTLEFNVDGNSIFSDELFTNINSKEDLDKANRK